VPDQGLDKLLWSTPVGEDGIAIVVHPSNAIADLTAAQLRTIWQGRVANWNALGGANVQLIVVARDETSSAAAILQTMVLGDRRVTRAAQLATTSQAVIDIVSAEPGAIGYVSMGYLSSAVRAVPLDGTLPTPDTVTGGQYPLRTPILFAGLHEPGNDPYRAFFAWAQSPEGQAVVRRHYGALATK
jgi:phosphate transport system substrate-binding protein